MILSQVAISNHICATITFTYLSKAKYNLKKREGILICCSKVAHTIVFSFKQLLLLKGSKFFMKFIIESNKIYLFSFVVKDR